LRGSPSANTINPMDYTTLGRTGLRVSRMGLGCGGPSRLGLRGGGSPENAESVVRRALELGVNFFDTAETYRTEEILGRALKGVPRGEFVISSKKAATDRNDEFVSGEEFLRGIERSLRGLGLDHVDVYHIHALLPEEYDRAVAEIVPAMVRAREQGKIGHLGVTEEFIPDPGHQMLSRSLPDPDAPWEVVMTGFNALNPSARARVFPRTGERGIGTLVMFAVRRALSRPERLRELLDDLERRGLLAPGALPAADPLGFLVGEGRAATLTEAAYRFASRQPGVDVVLSGTGSVGHLEANARAICSPALPADVLARLEQLFGGVDCVSGN
jgi:aryl-alcohol dehydrogenase-like predicted oxidoreductase